MLWAKTVEQTESENVSLEYLLSFHSEHVNETLAFTLQCAFPNVHAGNTMNPAFRTYTCPSFYAPMVRADLNAQV